MTKKKTMTYDEANKILGDRADWELVNMKHALEFTAALNTPEENERLEAVKTVLRHRRKMRRL